MKSIPEIIARLRSLLLGFNPHNPGTLFSTAHRPPMLSGPYQDFLGNITFFLNTEVMFYLVYILGQSHIDIDMDPDLEDDLGIFRDTLNINESIQNTGDHPWHIRVSVGVKPDDVQALSMNEVYEAIIEAISAAVGYISEVLDPETPPWKVDSPDISGSVDPWDKPDAILDQIPSFDGGIHARGLGG